MPAWRRFLAFNGSIQEIQNHDRQRTAISQSDLEPDGNRAPDFATRSLETLGRSLVLHPMAGVYSTSSKTSSRVESEP
jgi:hypothetical protein